MSMGETMTAPIDSECPACKSSNGAVRQDMRIGALGTEHVFEIHHEHNTYMPHGGHRARCSCGWSSDCYACIGDTHRALEVHLRRCRRDDFEELIARSSIGAAIADIKARGIDAHLIDLEREMDPRRRYKKTAKKAAKPKKLSPEDAAFMRGFGIALATIWRCHHDGQMIEHLIKENNFTLASFRGVGMLAADLAAIRKAMKR
jgi:hypothetical protein